MALLDRVSEGQLNERLMNAAGSDEPITRTCSVSFLFIYYHKQEQLQVKSVVRAFICALRAVSVIALEICAVSRMLGMKE